MKDVISKICNRLITNSHVIGIILNCSNLLDEEEYYLDPEDIDYQPGCDKHHLDMCVISKEAGNQKSIYMEEGYIICLRWKTLEELIDLLENESVGHDQKILYDKTGIINLKFRQYLVSY